MWVGLFVISNVPVYSTGHLSTHCLFISIWFFDLNVYLAVENRFLSVFWLAFWWLSAGGTWLCIPSFIWMNKLLSEAGALLGFLFVCVRERFFIKTKSIVYFTWQCMVFFYEFDGFPTYNVRILFCYGQTFLNLLE